MPHRLKVYTNSLVTRLLLVGALLLALGTAVTYWQLSRFLRDDVTQVLSSQQTALAEYVALDVDRELDNRLQLLRRLAQAVSLDALTRRERLQAWLTEQNALRPTFSAGLLVADLDGRVLGSASNVDAPTASSVADDPSFLRARAGASLIGAPRRVLEGSAPVLPMAVPVHDAAGAVVAVLMGHSTLSTHGFFDQQVEGRIGQTGGLLMVSPRDRLFVASTNPAMMLTPTPPDGVNMLHDRAMAGFRGTGTTVNAFGVEELSAIASVPTTGWFVVARLPLREALAAVRTRHFMLRQRVPVMLTVLALIGVGAAWLLQPLRRAARQADKMARGELPLAPLPVVRHDELGRLTSAFNRLLAKLEEQRSALAQMAHHDSLTGLPNRKLLADRLQQALARAQRNGTRVAVLFLDLDGFKHVNDSVGHEAGDEVLRQVATRLASVVRKTDTVARLGGDEFVLLAADLDGHGDGMAAALARKCVDAIGMPLRIGETLHTLGVSIGIAWSSGGEPAEGVLAAADRAMYAVKQGHGAGRRGGQRAGVAALAQAPDL